MKFADYIALARKVFPDLPDTLEKMPDDIGTYQLVFTRTCPADPKKFNSWDDWKKVDLFSLSYTTKLQIQNHFKHGHSIWEN